MGINVFELFAKIGLDTKDYEKGLGESETKFQKFGKSLGNGLKTAAKVGVAAIGTAATAIAALTKESVESYAEYEQLVGGVETLFNKTELSLEEYAASVGKTANDVLVEWGKLTAGSTIVQNNADKAFKNAGLSANAYMETVTSFSASLIQSLEGDTVAAAHKADVAITDMADNANKMGSSLETLQTAYAGFAKGQFMLLDNLKLGYGGTKEEMERLLEDAEKISGIEYDISSYADIVDAIHVIQKEMGIAGATADEAATTISGSLGMVKASWENVIMALSDNNADGDNLLYQYINDLTESVGVFADNILPVISTAVSNVGTLISELLPKIIAELPSLVQQALPPLIDALKNTISAVAIALPELLAVVGEVLGEQAIPLVASLITSILETLPQILETANTLIITLAQGISEAIPELLPTVAKVIEEMVTMLTSGENLSLILAAALQLVLGLGKGLADAIPHLVSAVTNIVEGVNKFATNPENIALIIATALELVLALGGGIISAIPELLKSVEIVILDIIANFKDADWAGMGTNLVEGFKNGIASAWGNLKEWFTNLFGDLTEIAKKILGIASPSKVFKKFGKFVDEGLAIGIEENANIAFSAVDDLSHGVVDAFGGQKYSGSIRTVSAVESSVNNKEVANLLYRVVDLLESGKAKMDIGNTRDLRRALTSG